MKRVLLAIGWTLLAGLASAADSGKTPQTDTPSDQQALERTLAALKLEIAGDNQGSREQLQKIIEEFPEAKFPRWSLGYVQDGENWWQYPRYVHETNRWPELYRYQQEREKRSDTFEDHLFLADGCRAHQLRDEERAHLTAALRHDSNFAEAHLRLGDHLIQGVWVTSEQMEQALRRQTRNQTNLLKWRPQAERMALEFSRLSGPAHAKTLEKHLNEIRTPDAIPALETWFASRGEIATAFYLNWAARVPSYETSLALAREAVFSESPRLRVLAQTLLHDRPRGDYVPWLLSGLETVTETGCEWEIDLTGLVGLRVNRTVVVNNEQQELTVTQQQQFVTARGLPSAIGFNADGSVDANLSIRGRTPRGRPPIPTPMAPVVKLLTTMEQSRALAAWQSASQETRTSRITRTLQEATGVQGNETADDWWAWWRQQNDYVLAKTKTKDKDRYAETWYVDERLPTPKRVRNTQITVLRPPGHSCFAPGTLVETEQGGKPIEKIQIGDRVLAQDVESGELGFSPVFETTTRTEADLVKIRCGSEDLICTRGHPFWVSGLGWRMAEELEPGAQLHTISGVVRIESVEPAGTGTVHNLVVADSHTYFAGPSRLFTHDVTNRTATDMILPGLRKDF